jgi:hypothetical protein
MSREVWGTCAVKDHLAQDAFIREVLLFDRLVVPYPSDEQERNRWQAPNPADPAETWDPDRLDELLKLLGTQDCERKDGRSLTWTSPWNEHRWQASRRQMADRVTTNDAFGMTRAILAEGGDLPNVVEAVAAYPSERRWREENRPVPDRRAAQDAGAALLTLARPLLLPEIQPGKERAALDEAVLLAREKEFQRARTAYHDWLREFVAPLQREGEGLPEILLDPASQALAKERLDDLLADERRIVASGSRKDRWSVTETATMVVATTATVGMAVAFPPAGALSLALGALAPTAGFAGWVAGKRAHTPEPRPLNGASVFVMTEKRVNR